MSAHRLPTQRLTSRYFPQAKQVYFSEGNKKYAETVGKTLFGSASAYVNALISKDRGQKPSLGSWKAKGEARDKRLALKKKALKRAKYKATILKRRRQVS